MALKLNGGFRLGTLIGTLTVLIITFLWNHFGDFLFAQPRNERQANKQAIFEATVDRQCIRQEIKFGDEAVLAEVKKDNKEIMEIHRKAIMDIISKSEAWHRGMQEQVNTRMEREEQERKAVRDECREEIREVIMPAIADLQKCLREVYHRPRGYPPGPEDE